MNWYNIYFTYSVHKPKTTYPDLDSYRGEISLSDGQWNISVNICNIRFVIIHKNILVYIYFKAKDSNVTAYTTF